MSIPVSQFVPSPHQTILFKVYPFILECLPASPGAERLTDQLHIFSATVSHHTVCAPHSPWWVEG